MNLYDIDQSIMDCIDMETGEIIAPEKLAELQMDRKTKIRNIACYIKDLRADAKAYDEEAKEFMARKKQATTKADNLTKYLSDVLNGEKIKAREYAIGWRRSEAVEVAEGASIPDEFLIQQEPKVDRAGIRKALQGGAIIPGCKLAKRSNIQIR